MTPATVEKAIEKAEQASSIDDRQAKAMIACAKGLLLIAEILQERRGVTYSPYERSAA